MSFKKPYLAIALVGVAAASGAAWWLQNKPNAPAAETAAAAASPSAPNAAGGGAPGGPAKPTAVEVAKVEQAKIVDETQSVGSLRSNQGLSCALKWVDASARCCSKTDSVSKRAKCWFSLMTNCLLLR